jgi:hypothetical protein
MVFFPTTLTVHFISIYLYSRLQIFGLWERKEQDGAENYIMRSFIFDPFKYYYNLQIREDEKETRTRTRMKTRRRRRNSRVRAVVN